MRTSAGLPFLGGGVATVGRSNPRLDRRLVREDVSVVQKIECVEAVRVSDGDGVKVLRGAGGGGRRGGESSEAGPVNFETLEDRSELPGAGRVKAQIIDQLQLAENAERLKAEVETTA